MGELDKSVVKKVKDTLGVDTDDVFELHRLLRQSRANKHPDKFTDVEAKEIAQKEFTELNNLYGELDSYIQQWRASMIPILASDNQMLELNFEHMKEIDIKEAEIDKLRQDMKSLALKYEKEKDSNDRFKKQIDELSNQRIDSIHDEIRSIYSSRKGWSGIGIAAICLSLTTTFPVVKDFCSQIGVTSQITFIALRLISLITIFCWIRSWLINIVVENTEYKILNDPSIEELLNVQSKGSPYLCKEHFFRESDIVSCLKNMLRLPARILLFGGYDKTINALTEDIIIQLDRKNLIQDTESDGLNKIFVVKKKSQYEI